MEPPKIQEEGWAGCDKIITQEVPCSELSPFGVRMFSIGLAAIVLGWSVFFFRQFGWVAITVWNLVPGFLLLPFCFWRAARREPSEVSIRLWRTSFLWHLLQLVSIPIGLLSCGAYPFLALEAMGAPVRLDNPTSQIDHSTGIFMLITLVVACLGSWAALVSDRQWLAACLT